MLIELTMYGTILSLNCNLQLVYMQRETSFIKSKTNMLFQSAKSWNESCCLDQVLTVVTWMSHSPDMRPIACNIGLIQSLVYYVVKVSRLSVIYLLDNV